MTSLVVSSLGLDLSNLLKRACAEWKNSLNRTSSNVFRNGNDLVPLAHAYFSTCDKDADVGLNLAVEWVKFASFMSAAGLLKVCLHWAVILADKSAGHPENVLTLFNHFVDVRNDKSFRVCVLPEEFPNLPDEFQTTCTIGAEIRCHVVALLQALAGGQHLPKSSQRLPSFAVQVARAALRLRCLPTRNQVANSLIGLTKNFNQPQVNNCFYPMSIQKLTFFSCRNRCVCSCVLACVRACVDVWR